MNIEYKSGIIPDTNDIISLYNNSGLARPTDNAFRIKKMFENSNLIVTAWHEKKLVGISRSLCDFSYICYLSDLAIIKDYQKAGIGKALISKTKELAGQNCTLLLLSAKDALNYYPKVGFNKVDNGFIIDRDL